VQKNSKQVGTQRRQTKKCWSIAPAADTLRVARRPEQVCKNAAIAPNAAIIQVFDLPNIVASR
jgi:hypothetical protein